MKATDTLELLLSFSNTTTADLYTLHINNYLLIDELISLLMVASTIHVLL